MPPEPKLSPIDVQTIHTRLRGRRGLWPLTTWGCAAALALVVAAFASQTETGAQRLQMALAGSGDPDKTTLLTAAENRADEAQTEVHQLAAKVQKLTADRELLNARLANIERDFSDLTGALGEKTAQIAKPTQVPKPAQNASLAPTKLVPLTLIAPLSLPHAVSALAPWPDQTPQLKAEAPKEPVAATAPTTTDPSEPHPVKTIAVTHP